MVSRKQAVRAKELLEQKGNKGRMVFYCEVDGCHTLTVNTPGRTGAQAVTLAGWKWREGQGWRCPMCEAGICSLGGGRGSLCYDDDLGGNGCTNNFCPRCNPEGHLDLG